MEYIIKKQTKKDILNNFKEFKANKYNLVDYEYSFYSRLIDDFKEDIKELSKLCFTNGNRKAIFINKSTLEQELYNDSKENLEKIKKYFEFSDRDFADGILLNQESINKNKQFKRYLLKKSFKSLKNKTLLPLQYCYWEEKKFHQYFECYFDDCFEGQSYLNKIPELIKTTIGSQYYSTWFNKHIETETIVEDETEKLGYRVDVDISYEKGDKIIIIIGNAYKNPFSTIQSIFHQFCIGIQSENIININTDLYQNLNRKKYISKEEYNNISKNYYLNYKYISETQADLFSYFILLTRALLTNNETIINNTIKQTKDAIFDQNLTAPLFGRFSYPILNEYFDDIDKLNELKGFITINNRIDYNGIYRFTSELTINKQKEYSEELLKINDIDGDIFNGYTNKDIIDSFIKKYSDTNFVKDYLYFLEKQQEYSKNKSKRQILEDEFSNLMIYSKLFNEYKHNNIKRDMDVVIESLENAVKEFETTNKSKTIIYK